jgi:hypothetical protein
VTSEGSASGRFTRAIQQGHLFNAEQAAREMRRLSLHNALDLVGQMARVRPDRIERAALRWHGRLELEATALTLPDAQFGLAALARLPADPEAIATLKKLLEQVSPTMPRGRS